MWPLRVRKASGIGFRLGVSIPHVYNATGKECRCKHIAAVEHLLLISSEASLGKKISIEEHKLKCPKCKKKKYVRDGWYRGEHEDRQRYKCNACGRRFRDNLGFEYRRFSRKRGCSPRWPFCLGDFDKNGLKYLSRGWI